MHHPSILVWLPGCWKRVIISIIRSSCCPFSSACFSWYWRKVSSLFWSASNQICILFSCAFWRFSNVADNWLIASFCEVTLRFLGRTDTVDFSTSFLDVSFESTSPSSQEDSSQSLLCGCFLGLWFFTLYNTLKTMPFNVRKTEIYFICSEAKLKGWPINSNKTIVTM